MTTTLFSNTRWRVLVMCIAAIQLLDIIIHAATNQLEALRVTSNLIILVWVALVLMGKLNARFFLIAISAIGLYLVLNILFIAREGVTNVAQGGGLRVTMFILVLLTVTLAALLTFLRARWLSN